MNFVLQIIIYIFSFLGGIVSIITIYGWIKPYKKITWRKVEIGIVNLKNQLIKSTYIPTLIIGIGRGGAILGALLSGCFGHIPLIVIDRIYDWDNNRRYDNMCEKINLTKNLERVLLIAGEVHTGSTAGLYIDYLQSIGANNIKFMTLTKDLFPSVKPDFYYIEMKNSNFKLPWMFSKTYKRDSLIEG